MMPAFALTFVVPLYESAETIAGVVHDIEGLTIEGGHEIVLVNDGSTDATSEVVRGLMRDARVPITADSSACASKNLLQQFSLMEII